MVTADDVKKMKVQELRDELDLRGLDPSGLKAALVERLEAALASDGGALTVAANGAATNGAPEQPAGAAEAPAAATKGRQPITFTAGASAAKPAPKLDAEPEKGLGSAAAPAADRSGSGKTPIPIPEAAAAAKAVAERLKARAERFGMPGAAPDADKKEQRAERFGGADKAARDKAAAKPGKAAAAAPAKDGELGGAEADKPKAGISKPVLSEEERRAELEKKKERAKRFNMPIAVTKEDEAIRKAARNERFAKGGAGGAGAGADAADKAKARAERFGISGKGEGTKGAPKEAGKRDAPAAAGGSAAAADFEAKKKARAERFAQAAK